MKQKQPKPQNPNDNDNLKELNYKVYNIKLSESNKEAKMSDAPQQPNNAVPTAGGADALHINIKVKA